VVLEKKGEDQFYRSCETSGRITKSPGENEYPTYNKKEEK
jgi:hypothetical protein